MSTNKANAKPNAEGGAPGVDEVALRAQIEAEMKAKLEAEIKAKLEAEMKVNTTSNEQLTAEAEAKFEKTFAAQEKSTKKMLEEQPKVKILIPEDPNNPNEVVPVGFNGVIYAIPTGQEFEVPQSIYETWKYAYDKTREANKRAAELLNKEIKIME